VIPHLTLLTVLHRVWGALGLLLGFSTFMLATGAVAIGVTKGGGEIAAGITAVAFAACAIALVAAGAANLWAGNAMQRRQPNGRIVALALGFLNLFVLPFGTALAIYGFWVLLHNETRTSFQLPASSSQLSS
jgi:hypothetical protein